MVVEIDPEIEQFVFEIYSRPEQILASQSGDEPLHERMGQGNLGKGLDFCRAQNPQIGLPLVELIKRIVVGAEVVLWQPAMPSNSAVKHPTKISPLLANVYLHYCFDLWVNVWRQKWAQGEVVVIRFADDTIVGFQYRTDADRFLENLRERLAMFGLELHPDKTRRIEFGRFAEENRKRRGEGKPETFDFLGFMHISGKNRLG